MFAIGIIVLGFILNSVLFFIFILADFFIRGFTEIKYSPVSYVSHYLSNTLSLPVRMIDKAPKIFAARLGFIMSGVIIGLFISGLTTAAFVVGGILVFFAGLEFLFAICVGCTIYTYLILPFYKK
jgi:hypothetical protein